MATSDNSHSRQIEELVTCAICLDFHKDPRILPCSHTFCLHCIKKVANNTSFNCPLRDGTNIDGPNIDQLPINRMVKSMVEFVLSINLFPDKSSNQQCDNCNENQAVNWCEKCTSYLCQSCTQSVHSIKIFQSHTVVPAMEKMQSFCMEHLDEKFKYWCKLCEILVCRDCLLFQHKDHAFASMKDAASEAKARFQETAEEIDEIKRNLTALSETTKLIINQRQEIISQEKLDIEQIFSHLQRILEERKLTMIKQLEDKELQTKNSVHGHQNIIDQHLSLTIVQELCIQKMLDSTNPTQILKFKSTLSHNYQDFIEQYKKIDEVNTISSNTFEKDDEDVKQISEKISELGRVNSRSHTVKRGYTGMNISDLDISKPGGKTKLTEKRINYARGYRFSLKQPFRLCSIRIQSDYIEKHVGFVVNDVDVVICNGTVDSSDSTMKWLTIPLKCDIRNNYTVLVWASSGNGSYVHKNGDCNPRTVNQNCQVESKISGTQANVGSQVSIYSNTCSIDMVLSIEK